MNSLNSDAGYAAKTTWRLLTRQELETLPDYSKWNPAIDTVYFPATVADYYWSSTTHAYGTDYAWIVAFDDGGVDTTKKTFTYYTRCVGSGP